MCAGLVGVLGGGQLGRMLALAGYPLGLRFRFLDPSPEAPAGQLAELVAGAYDDPAALMRLAEGAGVITYEFENVPAASTQLLTGLLPVYPPPAALDVSQDRLAEKRCFQSVGVPTPDFEPVDSPAGLARSIDRLGLPAVLKTRRLGYDGKGQLVLRTASDVDRVWQTLGGAGAGLILESHVPFERELSIIAVRGLRGQTAFYPLIENRHRGGILRLSLAPAPGVTPEVQAVAESHATRVLDHLNYAGVLTIELFQLGGQLLANEMAPRVHNSGHWTIEGAQTSQFENHLRAILGWPLGETGARGHCGMINLIGALPARESVLDIQGAHLHQYGKSPRPGRKLGHITFVEPSEKALTGRLLAARGPAGLDADALPV